MTKSMLRAQTRNMTRGMTAGPGGGGPSTPPYEISAMLVNVTNAKGGYYIPGAPDQSLFTGTNFNDGFTYHAMLRFGAHKSSYATGMHLVLGDPIVEHPSIRLNYGSTSWSSWFGLTFKTASGTYILNGHQSNASCIPTANYWAGMTISWKPSTGVVQWYFSFHDKAEVNRNTTIPTTSDMAYDSTSKLAFRCTTSGAGYSCGWGAIFHEFFDNQYVDLDVAANRRLFCGDNTTWGVKDPGADGSGFLGTQPLYFSHDGDPNLNVGSLTVPTMTVTAAREEETLNIPPII
jgi:hypothetical protein